MYYVFCFKQDIVSFFWLNFQNRFFVPCPIKDISFYKILSWEKIFIKSPYYEEKKGDKKEYTHPLSPSTPSHTIQNIILWKTKKTHLPTFKNNQTFPSHATQETTSWVSKKQLLCKGVELPRPSLHTQKETLLEKKRKISNPWSLSLKFHLELVIHLM